MPPSVAVAHTVTARRGAAQQDVIELGAPEVGICAAGKLQMVRSSPSRKDKGVKEAVEVAMGAELKYGLRLEYAANDLIQG